MRRIVLGLFAISWIFAAHQAGAQQVQVMGSVVGTCGSQNYPAGASNFITIDTSGDLCGPGSSSSSPITVKSGQYLSGGANSYQSISSLGSAQPLTVPSGSLGTQMCNEGGALRYRDDGSAPTASVGMPIAAGSPTAPMCFSYFGPLAAFQVIQQASGGGPLDILYYK